MIQINEKLYVRKDRIVAIFRGDFQGKEGRLLVMVHSFGTWYPVDPCFEATVMQACGVSL